MPEHPLVPIVRWWLWSVIACLIACAWPHWGLILLGTNCFGWWGAGNGCCGCTCTDCCGSVGNQVQIVVAGVANGGGCTNCTNKNATWTLTYGGAGATCAANGSGSGSSGGSCTWSYSDTSTANNCGGCEVGFGICLYTVTISVGGDITWSVLAFEKSSSSHLYFNAHSFNKTYSGGSESASSNLCTKWSATSFPDNGGGIAICCNWTSATASVTEL